MIQAPSPSNPTPPPPRFDTSYALTIQLAPNKQSNLLLTKAELLYAKRSAPGGTTTQLYKPDRRAGST